jgi:hypothetical protein
LLSEEAMRIQEDLREWWRMNEFVIVPVLCELLLKNKNKYRKEWHNAAKPQKLRIRLDPTRHMDENNGSEVK